VLEALRWLLTGEGYEPQFVGSTDAVLERMKAESFDLLLMDLNYSRDTTSGREGLELIPHVLSRDPGIPIVVMTGWGSIDTAVEAMRRGAKSFVQKPWEDVTLLEIIHREIAEARAVNRRDQRQQRKVVEERQEDGGICSPRGTPRDRQAALDRERLESGDDHATRGHEEAPPRAMNTCRFAS